MEGLIIDELEASFDSIEWTEKSCSLSSFLEQHGSTLPHVVKVIEGFCGVAASCTIDSGQILILHSLHKETKILAKDAKDYDLFIPENFQVKVEMVPKNAFEEYSTIQDLLRTFPNFFRVLDDIPSLNVTSGSIFQISRQNTFTNCIECSQVDSERDGYKLKFPLNLRGRFQPLQDSREFFLDEVLCEDHSLVTVHFVKSGVCGNNEVALDELGNIRLIGECETESVFATILNSNGKTLAVFPKNLNITIQPAELKSESYCNLREIVVTNQVRTVRRIQRLNKLVLYQARNPVRQFPVLEFLSPVKPKSRTQSVLDGCAEASQDYLVKERSNSTPLLATQPSKRSKAVKTTFKTKHKKPLQETASVPLPVTQSHPKHKAPPIPSHPTKQLPPLPPKDKPKQTDVCQGNTSESPLRNFSLDCKLISPTNDTPTPPPRRRRKKKKNDSTGKIFDDEGYVRMNSGDEMVNVAGLSSCVGDMDKRVSCAYEQMDCPLLGEQFLEQSNSPCLNNVHTASDVYEQMDPRYLNEKNGGTAYEEMYPTCLNQSSTKSHGDDESSKTLEELFEDEQEEMDNDIKGPVRLPNVDHNQNIIDTENSDTRDSHDYYNMKTLALTQDNENVSDADYKMTIEHQTTPSNNNVKSADESAAHDYYNMKSLDLTNKGTTTTEPIETDSSTEDANDLNDYYNMRNLNEQNTDYENTKSIEKRDRKSGDGDDHDYENTKEFDSSSLPRGSLQDAKSLNDRDSQVGIETSKTRSKKLAYENTGHVNREVPTPHNTVKTNVDEVDGEQSSCLIDDEIASCFSESALSQSSPPTFRCTTLTMTEQLVNQMTLRRPSPIGMEEEMLNDEDHYTNMDENNTQGDKCEKSSHGEYYTPMHDNDQTFQNQHAEHMYVPMKESLLRPDSGIYENERSDQESEGYEEIDFPVKTRKGKSQTPKRNTSEDLNEADSDSELHYHQVDLSSLALSLEDHESDGDIYEDIDMQEKPKQVEQRPTPPSRRARLGKSSKSEGKNSDCGAFHTPLTSPQGSESVIVSPTSPERDMVKCVTSPSSLPNNITETTKTPPTSPPRNLDKDQSSKSSDFEYIDDMQLHIAIRESMENIKKANKSRPPAPPPKKLNYVKVDPLPGAKPATAPKKTHLTNYSDVIATEKSPKQNVPKEEEMEYIDDCELHFLDIEKTKRQKKRKDNLKKQIEKDLPDKTGKTAKYGSPSSRDLKEPMKEESAYINKIREDESRDSNRLKEKETSDFSKPLVTKRFDTNRLVQVLPRDFNQSTLEKNSCDLNRSIKPAVPKKPKPRPETLKKPTVPTTTNVHNNTNSPTTRDSVKKRAMIPPPKPKRLFLDNNNEGETKTEEEKAKSQANSEYANTQESSKSTIQTQQQTEVARKKPLPLPRKKIEGLNSKTRQDS